MDLSVPRGINSTAQIDAKILENILKIQHTLLYSDKQLSELLQVKENELKRIFKKTRKLKVTELASLTDALSLSIESFVLGDLDLVAIEKHSKGQLDYIPERYTQAGQSRIRSALVYFHFIEQRLGWWVLQSLMRKFQITHKAIEDPNTLININFFKDITELLSKRGLESSNFYQIGAHSYEMNKNSEFSKKLEISANPTDAYDRLCYELKNHIESNSHYRILRQTPTTIEIESKDNPDTAQALKLSHLGNPFVCQYKAGFFSRGTSYIDLPSVSVKEIKCAHYGDPSCIFEVNIELANKRWNKTH